MKPDTARRHCRKHMDELSRLQGRCDRSNPDDVRRWNRRTQLYKNIKRCREIMRRGS